MARATSPSHHPSRPHKGRPPGQDGASVAYRGRGARSNISGRYEKESREPIDDGWEGEEDKSPLRTDVTIEVPRKIINYINSPYVGFDRSINPYRGCEHGCTYCFARPSHAYYGLSPGRDFEQKLFAKPNAAERLEKELISKTYKPRLIAIGTNTDPYQPIERQFKLMRGILKVLSDFKHPVSLLTKSAMITRDIDILDPMASAGIVKAMLSITTLDPKLSRAMEPRASAPKRRFEAVRQLSAAGIPVGVMTAPMIPGLNDSELENILEASKEAGAQFVGYTVIRLPMEVSGLFQEWLESAYPDRAARVMRHMRELNGGVIYDANWSRAKKPRSVYAKLLADRFAKAARRLSLSTEMPALNIDAFQPPPKEGGQLSLFSESPSG